MRTIIIFFLLLNSLSMMGQVDSVYVGMKNFEKDKTKPIKTEKIKIDSIQVQVSFYKDRIETESTFDRSKSMIAATYLLFGESYSKIVTRENSSMPEDFYHTFEFDFKDGKAYFVKESLYSSARMHGIAGRLDKEVLESYNKALNVKFLEMYVVELYEKIKDIR